MILLQIDDSEVFAPWLAPYVFAIVILGILFYAFKIFEIWYGSTFNKPLFRQILSFRKLEESQLEILNNHFPFFRQLSKKHQKQFEHRVATFLQTKNFIGREGLVVDEEMKVTIAALGCILSFGRKNYLYHLIDSVLIYPGDFYSQINEEYHSGEFNPKEKVLVLNWDRLKKDLENPVKNKNLGIHEFMHAMQLESRTKRDSDGLRFQNQFQNILKVLTNPELKDKLNQGYLRPYAFNNQFEFMAVMAEYFILSPKEFKKEFPQIYNHFKKLLNFRFLDY